MFSDNKAMTIETRDTIFALASATGRAGVAVFRVSGPQAATALERLTGKIEPTPRVLAHQILKDPDSGEMLDDGMTVWMPAPASFTGEDVVEFHVHGSRAVIAALTDVLSGMPGLRLAEPGEFTRRAFQNNKLDLTAAEGLADLINAETEAQRRQAFRQLQGELGRLTESWREQLVRALAHLEASIDFIEEDLPAELDESVRAAIIEIQRSIAVHLADNQRGERLRDGLQIAIIGPPNAGKSSLLNILAKRDAAIVAATAGTTRDVIEVHLNLNGYPVVVADTAGLRASDDPIEIEGVRRASVRAQDSDLRLVVLDQADWPKVDSQTAALIDDDALIVINKIDQGMPQSPLEIQGLTAIAVSVKTGAGIEGLLEKITHEVVERCHLSAAPAITRVRHRQALEDCSEALLRALATTNQAAGGRNPELVAEDLRLAARSLGRITGRVDVEDILDVIFREFCIGK